MDFGSTVFGLFLAGLFCGVAIFARRFADWVLRSQSRTWGFRFKDGTLRWTTWIVRLVGLAGLLLMVAAAFDRP